MGEGEVDFVFWLAVEFEEDSFLLEVEDVIVDLVADKLFKIHLQLYYRTYCRGLMLMIVGSLERIKILIINIYSNQIRLLYFLFFRLSSRLASLSFAAFQGQSINGILATRITF